MSKNENSTVQKICSSTNKDRRSIGFLPSYLPKGYSETKNSSNGNNSFSNTGPPYPTSFSSEVKENRYSHPAIEIKVIPPTPTDELSKSPLPPLNAINSTEAANDSKNSNKNKPSAPPIDIVNLEMGITYSIKDDIDKEFEKMINYLDNIEGDNIISSSEERIHELLLLAEQRLSQIEKDDYLLKIDEIKKKREEWIEEGNKKRIIDEVNLEMEITLAIKQTVEKELEKMTNYLHKIEGKNIIISSEKRIRELLVFAKERLSKSEKDDYLLKVIDIKEERKKWIKEENKKQNKEDCGAILSTTHLHIIAMISEILIIILYSNSEVYKKSKLFYMHVIVAFVMTSIFYTTRSCVKLLCYPINTVFSILFVLGFLYIDSGAYGIALILCYVTAAIYTLDALFKVIFLISMDSSNQTISMDSSRYTPSTNSSSPQKKTKESRPKQSNHRSSSNKPNNYSSNSYYRPNVIQKNYYTTNRYISNNSTLPAGINYTSTYMHEFDSLFENAERGNSNDQQETAEGTCEGPVEENDNRVNSVDDNDYDGICNEGGNDNNDGGGDNGGYDYDGGNGGDDGGGDYDGGNDGGGDYGGGDDGGGDYGGGDDGGGDCGGDD